MFRGTSDIEKANPVEGGNAIGYGNAARPASTSAEVEPVTARICTCPSRPRFEQKTQKRMILMRGLPSCGKSFASRQLVIDGGIHIEFDEFFYTQAGDNPARYDWSAKLLPSARRWNYERIKRAIQNNASPIVVDSDNSPCATTGAYVTLALDHGYQINFKEPETPWWREIRRLLDDKKANREALRNWAQKLVLLSRGTHRVPLERFLHRIERWDNLTVETILSAA